MGNTNFSDQPLISVVMCVFNGEATVAAAIDDILDQTYPNIELIISDDASTDNTSSVLDQYKANSKVRVIRQTKNLGVVLNKNFAINLAKGEFITQQDHDDRSSENRIARQLKAINDSGALISACGVRRIDKNGFEVSRFAAPKDIIIDRMPIGDMPFFFAPVMFNKCIWKQHGPFNEYFNGTFGEDNYFISSVLRSHPIAVIADCLYDYVDSPSSATNRLRNKRTLAMVQILAHLTDQTNKTGTNDLENENFNALNKLENSILSNRQFLSEQYRTYAARAIDHRQLLDAVGLIGNAALSNPFSKDLYHTIFYWLRCAIDRNR